MTDTSLHREAETCRQQALSYLGQPEGPLLLRLAREFDRLEEERHRPRLDQAAGSRR